MSAATKKVAANVRSLSNNFPAPFPGSFSLSGLTPAATDEDFLSQSGRMSAATEGIEFLYMEPTHVGCYRKNS